jgi:hypothetical protein
MSGEWNTHYADLTEPILYGDVQSYQIAAQFVADRGLVEDWGCGGGGLRTFLDPAQPYRGIDGSFSPFADVIIDLANYRSHDAGCIVLRHVLEHSHQWATILDNAVQSFRSRLCVVLFTPPTDTTCVLSTEPDYGDVPVISFALDDLLSRLHGLSVQHYEIEGSHYGVETVIKVRR